MEESQDCVLLPHSLDSARAGVTASRVLQEKGGAGVQRWRFARESAGEGANFSCSRREPDLLRTVPVACQRFPIDSTDFCWRLLTPDWSGQTPAKECGVGAAHTNFRLIVVICLQIRVARRGRMRPDFARGKKTLLSHHLTTTCVTIDGSNANDSVLRSTSSQRRAHSGCTKAPCCYAPC